MSFFKFLKAAAIILQALLAVVAVCTQAYEAAYKPQAA